jgi:lysozyme
MQLSQTGITFLTGLEGLSLKAYRDADGWSIGYGHFLGKDPSLASKVIDRAEAERLFRADIAKFEAAVSMTTPNATQPQFDAMVSLTYNIGTAGFAGSTVARLHNMGDTAGAADAFLMWNKSTDQNGVKAVNPVLVRRREKERSVYLGGAAAPPGSFPVPQPPESSEGWPSTTGTFAPPASASTAKSAVGVSLVATLIGWLIYRLSH